MHGQRNIKTQQVSAVAFLTLQLMSFSHAHCNAQTLAIEKKKRSLSA